MVVIVMGVVGVVALMTMMIVMMLVLKVVMDDDGSLKGGWGFLHKSYLGLW